MSLGGPIWSKFKNLCRAGNNGVLVVAAAGNEAGSTTNSTISRMVTRSRRAIPRATTYPISSRSRRATTSIKYGYTTMTFVEAARSASSQTGATHPCILPPLEWISSAHFCLAAGQPGRRCRPRCSFQVSRVLLSQNPSYTPRQMIRWLNSVDHAQELTGGFTGHERSPERAGGTHRFDIECHASHGRDHRRCCGHQLQEARVALVYRRISMTSLRRGSAGKKYAVRLDVPRRADYDIYVWKPGAADAWQLITVSASVATSSG